MQHIQLGSLSVSRFILGGNPISGFSHLTREVDFRMRHYFSAANVKRLLMHAEDLGVNTVFARTDRHIVRLFTEYWDEGGGIQWVAQTAPELGSISAGIKVAVDGGARACYIHGGVMDHMYERGDLSEVVDAIKMIRDAGMPVGVAGHVPDTLRWADGELDVDFYMTCYYNPIVRTADPANPGAGVEEVFDDADRDRMVKTIAGLSKPAIHYKILGAGRNDPAQAFAYVARHLRPSDGVCVGIYDENAPGMLRDDIALFEAAVEGVNLP